MSGDSDWCQQGEENFVPRCDKCLVFAGNLMGNWWCFSAIVPEIVLLEVKRDKEEPHMMCKILSLI